IRDLIVTGVQTCALPIYYQSLARPLARDTVHRSWLDAGVLGEELPLIWMRKKLVIYENGISLLPRAVLKWKSDEVAKSAARKGRSEERRVGKEDRWGWAA